MSRLSTLEAKEDSILSMTPTSLQKARASSACSGLPGSLGMSMRRLSPVKSNISEP
jgi:hypothetical protein